MDEIWKDIPDYEGIYQVSNLGRVKSFKRNKEIILKLCKDKEGYLHVSLYKNKNVKSHTIHRLVLFSFKPKEYFENCVVNHKDGNKSNNTLDNLEWCTITENNQHACDIGLKIGCKGEKNGSTKLKENQIRKIRLDYKNKIFNQTELSKIFNVSITTIGNIVKNKTWSHI